VEVFSVKKSKIESIILSKAEIIDGEVWKDTLNQEGCEVSSYGRVKKPTNIKMMEVNI